MSWNFDTQEKMRRDGIHRDELVLRDRQNAERDKARKRATRWSRVHRGRRRAGSALSFSLAVIISFVLLFSALGFTDVFQKGTIIGTTLDGVYAYNFMKERNTDVVIYNYRFSDDYTIIDFFENSLSFIAKTFSKNANDIIDSSKHFLLVCLWNKQKIVSENGFHFWAYEDCAFVVVNDVFDHDYVTLHPVLYSSIQDVDNYSIGFWGKSVRLNNGDSLITSFSKFSYQFQFLEEGGELKFTDRKSLYFSLEDAIAAGNLFIETGLLPRE